MLIVPLSALRQSVPLPAELDGIAACPAWCSEIVAGNSLRQVHRWEFFFAKRNLFRSQDARKIAAFDKWTDLRDRNFGNVIRSPKGGYVAIDHETLLHDLLWLPWGRRYEERCLTFEASKALTEADFRRFQVDMANAAKGHAAALASVQRDVDSIIATMMPTPAAANQLSKAILTTLAQRSDPDWMGNHLGIIA
ncbi:MAG: hypothetical protein QM702_08175 [Rubrivivax sp.]